MSRYGNQGKRICDKIPSRYANFQESGSKLVGCDLLDESPKPTSTFRNHDNYLNSLPPTAQIKDLEELCFQFQHNYYFTAVHRLTTQESGNHESMLPTPLEKGVPRRLRSQAHQYHDSGG